MTRAAASAVLAGSVLCAPVGAQEGRIGCPPPRVEYRVAQFGAVGDGVTDDGPALREALAAAADSLQPAAVILEPKTYRIGPYPDRWCALFLIDAANVLLDGNGATLVFHPKNRALLLYRAANITVRDLAISFDPLPFTQGDVTALDRERGEFAVRLHEGYPDPPSHEWCVAAWGERMAWRHGVFIEPDRRAFTHRWVYVQEVQPVPDQPRTYRVVVDPGMANVLEQVAVGQRFVFRNRTADRDWQQRATIIGDDPEDKGVYHSNPAATIQVRFSRNCLLEAVTIHVSPEMCFRLTGSDDVHLRECRVTYAPGTDNLITSLSDGIHCKNARRGPFIEDCVFEGLMDDSINISTMSDDVVERLSDTEFRTLYSDIAYYDSCVQKGDWLQAWDPVAGVPLGEIRVTEVQFISSHQRIIRVADAVEGLRDANTVGRESCTRLYIRKQVPFLVKGCTFGSQLKTAIVARDPGTVEGCTFDDTAYGVHAHNAPDWGEGPWPQRLHVLGNTFRNVEIGAVVAIALSANTAAMQPLRGDFVLRGNEIEADDGDGFHLTNLAGIEISDNTIVMAPSTPDRHHAIRLINCADVAIDWLRVTDKRPGSAAIVAERTEDLHTANIRADLAADGEALRR